MPPFYTKNIVAGLIVTTRGMKQQECADLAHWIADILDAMQSGEVDSVIENVKVKVQALCKNFPAYRNS